jgi:hypothetical protein
MGKVYKFPSGELIETVEVLDTDAKLRVDCDSLSRIESRLRGLGMKDAADLVHKTINNISGKMIADALERRKEKKNEAV